MRTFDTRGKWPQRCGFALLVLSMVACDQTPPPAPPPPPRVLIAQPSRAEVADYVDLTGNTQASLTASLTARVEGTLQSILFRDGDWVQAGQELFVIEPDVYAVRLREAEGRVEQMRAALIHAEAELSRVTALMNRHLAAETDVANWRYQRDSGRAQLIQAEAQRDSAKINLAYTQVRAPFAGRIDRRLVDPGNVVGVDNRKDLATISRIDPLYVYFTAGEAELKRRLTNIMQVSSPLRPLRFEVKTGTADPVIKEGHLDFTATSIDTATGTLLVRGSIANDDGALRPGQFVRVRLFTNERPLATMLIPDDAISYDQQGAYVLLVGGEDKVERRSVVLGHREGKLRVVISGLSGNERLIVAGLLQAFPGAKVAPRNAEEMAQAGGSEQRTGP